MSADNGIYILVTKYKDAFEYRVVHAQAIENIYAPDSLPMNPVHDPQYLLDYFGECKVYHDEGRATKYAVELLEEAEYVEYGIALIYDFCDKTFAQLIGE